MIGIIYSAFDEHVPQMRVEGNRPVNPSTTALVNDMPSCFDADDLTICEALFENTNLYKGPFWDRLQPLPETRTHTALSVGDRVFIDDRVYLCKSFGWEAIS